MSDDLTPKTPREVRMCREAYKAGLRDNGPRLIESYSQDRAAYRYPMPTVEVPREWVDKWETRWRVVAGVIQYRHDSGEWDPINDAQFLIDSTRVIAWADLLANPTERKPADEVTP